MHSGTAPAKQEFDPLTTMVAVAAVTARIEGVTERLKDATGNINNLSEKFEDSRKVQQEQFDELKDSQAKIMAKLMLLMGNNGNNAVEPVIPRVLRKLEKDHERLDGLELFQKTSEPEIKKIPNLEDNAKSNQRLRRTAWVVLAAFASWVAQSGWQDVKPWVYKALQSKPLAEQTRR